MRRALWEWMLFIVCFVILTPAAWADAIHDPAAIKSPVRVFHFVMLSVELERAHWMVSEARREGFNAVQVQLTDGVQLDHAPWKPRVSAWTKKEFTEWVEDVRKGGLEVIPEIKLLTQQQKFFQGNYPSLMFNKSTYDPRKEETYQIVFPLLDEIIEAIQPKAIHIGHDEVAGHKERSRKKRLRTGEEMLPAELFLKDVLRIHDYLKNRSIETWMWGDMLISPDEFPLMLDKHLHGTLPGYGKLLRNKLPRDIVICDWHYFDRQPEFPSLAKMQEEGFRVIGTIWKKEQTIKNFSRYAAQHGAYGMMAGTFFHVHRNEWNIVENIILTSGKAFSKDFPDVK